MAQRNSGRHRRRRNGGRHSAPTKQGLVVSTGNEAYPKGVLGAFEMMERMVDSWLGPFRWVRPPAMEDGLIAPKVDVVDRDQEVLVRAEVPRVSKDDIEVSISGNLLTIKGATKREVKEERGDYYRAEMSRGVFARTLSLPTEVDESKAKAALKDGVLELALPKKVEKPRSRMIKVS